MHISFRPVRTLGWPQLRRLRELPDHPVHAVAMESLRRRQKDHQIALLEQPTPEQPIRVHGYVVWRRVDGWDGRPGPHVKLDYLYVVQPGREHGSRLLSWLLDHERADTTVMSTMHAREFYLKHGFRADASHCLRLVKRFTP